MTGISGRYAIVGVGESDIGRHLGRSGMALHLEAAKRAMADAGLAKTAIDGLVTRPSHSAPQFNYSAVLAGRLGIQPTYFTDVALGGASSTSMIMDAVAALDTGLCTAVLCVNGDAQTSRGPHRRGGLTNWIEDFEHPFGMLGAPESYGLGARRHMYEYGTTSAQFGAVAVACRKHAGLNPKATFRTPMTLADHQASRFVAEPFRLLDCCPVTDGAAAIIVTSAERARDLKQRPVYLLGMGQGFTHSDLAYTPSMTTVAMRSASQRAYAMAKLGPRDIDLAELYDCFTYVVLVTLEDYGFCAKGEGGAFVEGGRIELGGDIPVNTGGGLLSHGHASGALLVTEAAIQMRGAAGARQVADAETAIVSGQCGVTGINVCLIVGKHPN
ncbi:MAG TPA: thiolase family protein [Stellaceae bacterium]|nr:thiolase family protein [Stellaceae bacterium]